MDQSSLPPRHRPAAFSLVELVVVVVVIGLIAAIAVPRLSRGSTAAVESSVKATIAEVQSAIDRYYAEHGRFPGHVPGSGVLLEATFVAQLTKFSDKHGNTSGGNAPPYNYGPYIRRPFPTNPINGLSTVRCNASPTDAVPAGYGWLYIGRPGVFGIVINATEKAKYKLVGHTPDDLALSLGG